MQLYKDIKVEKNKNNKYTIETGILDTCCISANPNFRSVNNSDFYKTNMVDIYNFSKSIVGWRWEESDIVLFTRRWR